EVAADGAQFVALGPGKSAYITFAAPVSMSEIQLYVSTPVPDQTLSVQINKQIAGLYPLEQPYQRMQLQIVDIPPTNEHGRYVVSIEIVRQSKDGVGLLLYRLDVND
ncbi:MAG: hypothetical protein WD873_06590, partial [Candidatus Hydrogenedentales bacterium]